MLHFFCTLENGWLSIRSHRSHYNFHYNSLSAFFTLCSIIPRALFALLNFNMADNTRSNPNPERRGGFGRGRGRDGRYVFLFLAYHYLLFSRAAFVIVSS